MAIKRNEIKVHLEKATILCIRTVYRSARYHPFIFSLVLFLLALYRCFPCLFAFLVSSSPVIVCTTLLLGLLLSYGEPNIPEFAEENRSIWEVSSTEIGSPANQLYVKKDENLSVENHIEKEKYNEEIELRDGAKAIADVGICQATEQYEGKKKFDNIMQTISSIEEVKKEGYFEDEVIQHEACQGQAISENRDICVEDLGGVTEVGENFISSTAAVKEDAADLKLAMAEPALDHHFESYLGLPQQSTDHHDSSDTDSDRAESSSPDASMADIIPMLDELETLLKSEHPQHVSISKSDGDAEVSSPDQEMYDISDDEKYEEEKDGEAQEEKDDDTEAAVKWTEDDQKNVMDLGSSELERNRRLESLIAKRRARKNLTFRMERNLIDLDADDSFLGMGELSRFRVQVPSRRNPFDISYDSEETLDLPPIPGSAPSSLLPRRNPFDLFYDQQERDSSLTGETWGQQDFVSAPHREMLFRRNETFSLARRELLQERCHSRLKPYFVAGKTDSEEGSSTFHRQFSDRSVSKGSSIPESDTVSSPTDLEYRRELELHDAHWEVKPTSLVKHDSESVDSDSQPSEELESVDAEEVKTEHLTNDLGTHVDDNLIIQENEQVIDDIGEREQVREEMHLNLSISDSEKLEVIERKHDEPNSASSNGDHEGFKTTFFQQSSGVDQTINLIGSDNLTRVDQVFTGPVYDPSPPEAGKSLSKQSSLVEALPDAGQGGNANSPLKFDLNEEVSEVDSSPRTLNATAALGTGDLVSVNASMEELASVSNGPLTSFQSPVFAHDNKLISREINGISKVDAKLGKSDAQEESSQNLSEFQKASTSMVGYRFPSEDISIDESQVSTLDLPSIAEENQEHSKQKEDDKSCTNHAQVFGLADIQINEDLKVLGSDFEQEAPFFHNHRQEIIHMDGDAELLHRPKGSTSDIFPAVPIQDGGLTGLRLIELTQSLDTQVPSIDDLSKSGDTINSAFMAKHEIGSRKMVDSSDEESEEIHPLILETDDIAESFPAEMDGDMDFHIEEPSYNHHELNLMFQNHGQSENIASSSRSSFEHDYKFSEDRYTLNADTSVNQQSEGSFGESQEAHAEVSQPGVLESEIWSSFDSMGNFEQTVYNPKIRVLDASMVQQVGSGSNQLLEEAVTSIVSESDFHGPTTAELVLEFSKIDTAQVNTNRTMVDSELLVVEARSVEDIHSVFKQISQTNLDKPLFDEVESRKSTTAELVLESSEIDTTQINMNRTMADSELLVVEARSVEDIHAAFEQISQTSLDKPPYDEVESQNSTTAELVLESSEIDTARMNKNQTMADSEILVVEARSVEDIHAAFEQISQTSLDKPLFDEVGSQNSTTAELVLESIEIDTARINKNQSTADSVLLVVEARSVEDIHSAFEQIRQTSLDKPLHDEVGSQNSLVNVNLDAKQLQSDLYVVEAKSIEDIDKAFSQLSDITSKKVPEIMETEFLDVQRLDKISSPLKEPFAIETNSSIEDTFGEKSGAEIDGDKEQKDENPRNLNSSSSSSDSNISKSKQQD